MPILYERTDGVVRHYGNKISKLSPGPFEFTSFAIGVAVGFFVLPILLPIVGYQVTKRWGPPAPSTPS
jgi:hypothetical protein